MHALRGEFLVSWNISTAPLTQIFLTCFFSGTKLRAMHTCVHLFPAFRCILDLDELKKLQMDRRNVCNSDFYMWPAFSQLLIMKLTKTQQSLPRFTFFRMALPTMILMMLAVFKRVIGWKVSFVLDHTLWFDRKFSQLMLFEFWQNWGYWHSPVWNISSLIFFLVWTGKKFQFEISS